MVVILTCICQLQFPNLKEIQDACILARNHQYLEPEEVVPLQENDEIAIIPPISGG